VNLCLPTRFVVLTFLLAGVWPARSEQPTLRVFLNGQEIQGQILQTNDTIYLPLDAVSRALGAKITIQTNQIMIATPPPVATERATTSTAIRGTLTWQNNMFDIKAADAGARVWLIPETQVAAIATAAGGNVNEPIPQKATGWDQKLATEFSLPTATTDRRGDFAFGSVAPGNYLLVLKSKRANGLAARDRDGKVRFLTITVRSNQVADGSLNFGVTAYRD
jgi:hypothetical protein